MSAPRPSRGARWGIGLGVSAVLLFVGIVAGAVAIGQAAASGGDCVTEPGAPGLFCPDSSYTGRASATVTSSRPNTDPLFGDSADAPGWFLDLVFATEDGERVQAYDVAWPQGDTTPGTGSFVLVAYDPSDPELSVASAVALDAAKNAAPPARGASPAALWTTGAGFAAALAALLGTVVWARRAPRRERPAPVGWSAPGYAYVPGHGYGAPGYAYPPPGYGPPGYPPAGYAQPYPGYAQQYPPPTYAPTGYPAYPPPAGPPAAPPSAAPPDPGPPSAPPAGPPAADAPPPPSAPPSGWNTPG